MNALDKIKKVQKGLKCASDMFACRECPYASETDCKEAVMTDAGEVINALRDELKKRTNKAVEAKPGFIVLTTGIVKESGGAPVWYNTAPIAVRVDDILMVSDYKSCDFSCGSEVRFKTNPQTVIFVQETIEEILGKIAKGEYE